MTEQEKEDKWLAEVAERYFERELARNIQSYNRAHAEAAWIKRMAAEANR